MHRVLEGMLSNFLSNNGRNGMHFFVIKNQTIAYSELMFILYTVSHPGDCLINQSKIKWKVQSFGKLVFIIDPESLTLPANKL